MHFTEFFIRRTITTTLLMLAVSIFGVIAYFGLPVSDLGEHGGNSAGA
jgi:HAE1 family hydrophobic/amphiphilic exporter-1